jgi:hypothetical protein
MALTSPGVEVTVIDESQYIPSAVNTVPYFLIATAQNKVSGDGITVAAGTTAPNANQTYLITSQRDLVATFGVPFFYNTTTGTPINGYELNEYGLLAAYSALGVTNRAYVQRVDVNLTDLTASLSRPRGEPNDGTYWLNTADSRWGIQEWNQATAKFTVKTPIVITEPNQIVDFDAEDYVPLESIGAIGDYAVVTVTQDAVIRGYYKNINNEWVLIGSDEWKTSWPTVVGTASPSSLTNGAEILINDSLVTVGSGGTDLTVAGLAQAINNAIITGVTAAAIDGKLAIFADSTATNDGSTGGPGIVAIDPGPTFGQALLAALGITSNEYLAPQYLPSFSYQVPRWRTTDDQPAPTGSVWNNLSPANNGVNLALREYDATIGEFVARSAPVFTNPWAPLDTFDPGSGGRNIPEGTTYTGINQIFYQTTPNRTFALRIYYRIARGATVVTGSTTPTSFVVGNQFFINASNPNLSLQGQVDNSATVTIGGTGSVSDFLTAVSSANLEFVTASVDSAGKIVLTHSAGGFIQLENIVGTPITTAGFTTSTAKCTQSTQFVNRLVLSNWVTVPLFEYTASATAPDQDPADGRLWYYSTVSDADILIKNGSDWEGYQNVTNDVRGFDLSLTNAAGPIISATAPTTQTDAARSALQYGDLWIDTSDLENYPRLSRWEPVNGVDQWVGIDTSDQVTENGILFGDARWAPSGDVDPVTAPIPSIESLLVSDYLDLDAPDSSLYPQGMLLFNTRRSGYNVKSFQSNYFNGQRFPDDELPDQRNTWLTVSGNKLSGAMWSGRQAQRQIIIQALKAGIDTSSAAREEQNGFNIIATPGYPELIPNMIALSNERNNTLFVVGDTPLRLDESGNSLVTWATNNLGLGLPTGDGQIATSNYAASFYPSCLTTDLSGNTVVAPPSHMMVRTILRSDAVSYPWLAPAGTRRGVVDNALGIGYLDAQTGEFKPLSVGQSLRDILYERNVNPITFIPGVGITNFGNKTSTTVTTALDRINVARLVAFLRGRLEEIGKLFLFEPNDEITRNEITNTVNSLMIDLVAKRALYDYLVVCDLSNNTPARIDRNELWVDIAIEPVKAVEFIYIPLRIKNTGEIAAGG